MKNSKENENDYVEILLRQNAELELAVKQLTNELADATNGILLRGCLFKSREREISFAAKWSLRYFVLQGCSLSYYLDETDHRPRTTIDLTNCKVQDEGNHNSGHFHIFGLYLASSDETNEGPQGGAILRLSTKNEPMANQWIKMLERACGQEKTKTRTESQDSDSKETEEIDSGKQKPILKRISSSKKILNNFENRVSSPRHTAATTTTGTSNGDNSSKVKPFKPSSFPASKSIHKQSEESPLSLTAKEQNYRGFFHLMVIIMSVTHFRQVYDNLMKVGFLLSPSSLTMSNHPGIDIFRPFLASSTWVLGVLASYCIEVLAHKKKLSEKLVLFLNTILIALMGIGPMVLVWNSNESSALCMIYLLQSVIMFMKVISYAHVNRDLRIYYRSAKQSDRIASSSSKQDNNAKPLRVDNIFLEIKDLEAPVVQYPQNLTVGNLAYFCVAPTLCYQMNYPRSKEIRWKYVFTLVFRLIFVGSLIIYICEQHINPVLVESLVPMKNFDAIVMFRNLLAICIPNTYVWLGGFYFFFHLWLNLFAELTRFGDRKFYLDWWNARSIDEYWRKWNLPVHNWLIRHIYYPLIRQGRSRNVAVFVVFFYSAVMHEIIISVPFRVISWHAFLGMIAQAPLVEITKKVNAVLNNSLLGNCFFWMTFCIVGKIY